MTSDLHTILADCARKGEPRPTTKQIAAALGITVGAVNERVRRLVHAGELVVEGTCANSRIYVASEKAWTGWLQRKARSAPAKPEKNKTRKCVVTRCRAEFLVEWPGQWYCRRCRNSGRHEDDGLPRQWEYL